jgi:hypothetical protein
MSFTATPVDGSSPAIPMSSVVPDGTNTPLALEGGPSISTGGNTLAPASIYVKDGNDLAQGATTDAAVTGDTAGSLSGKLRGISKIFNDVWDSVNHLFAVNTKQVGGTAVDTNSGNKSAGTQRIVIATDQPTMTNPQPVSQNGTWTVQPGNTANTTPWLADVSDRWSRQAGQIDIARVLGAAMAANNPAITEANIQTWLRNAQIFTATTGANAGASQTSGANLFNGSTTKSALIFSVFVMNSNPGQGIFTSLRKVTVNPSYANAITPVDNALDSSAASLMVGSWVASTSVAGTDLGTANDNSVNSKELLANGRAFILRNGQNSGLSVFVGQGGTGGFWSVTYTYAEF